MDIAPLVAFVTISAISWVSHQRARTRRGAERLDDLASLIGLRLEGEPSRGRIAQGDYRGRAVRVRFQVITSNKQHVPRLDLEVYGLHPALRIGRQQSFMTQDLFKAPAPDLVLGDSRFDGPFTLDGPPLVLRALLGAETRERLAWTTEARSMLIEGGALRLSFEMQPERADEIRALLDRACDIAEALPPGPPETSRLLAVAEADPLPRVRLGALAAALSLPSPEDRRRAAALAARSELPVERALAELLEGDPARIARLNADAARQATPLAPGPVTAILGAAGAETQLLALLRADSPAVLTAAVGALAAHGSTRAVEPLLELQRSARDEATRGAAERAIRSIQERLGPRDRGALTLSEAEQAGGALSLAGARGALSEPPRR